MSATYERVLGQYALNRICGHKFSAWYDSGIHDNQIVLGASAQFM